MDALSLWQPWASLILDGRKTVETRSWRGPSYLIGRDLIIHAAKRVERDDCRRFGYDYAAIPRGVALCVVRLDGYVQFTQANRGDLWKRTKDEEYAGDYEVGRWGWVLSNVRPILPPFETRGYQGIFDIQLPKETSATPIADEASKAREAAKPAARG